MFKSMNTPFTSLLANSGASSTYDDKARLTVAPPGGMMGSARVSNRSAGGIVPSMKATPMDHTTIDIH